MQLPEARLQGHHTSAPALSLCSKLWQCSEYFCYSCHFSFFRFMPPDDPLGRHGPTLNNFLSKKPALPESTWQPCPYGGFRSVPPGPCFLAAQSSAGGQPWSCMCSSFTLGVVKDGARAAQPCGAPTPKQL